MGCLVGRGIADITGEVAECGLLGYGMTDQQSAGLHTRLRTRAFAFAAGEAADRLLPRVEAEQGVQVQLAGRRRGVRDGEQPVVDGLAHWCGRRLRIRRRAVDGTEV